MEITKVNQVVKALAESKCEDFEFAVRHQYVNLARWAEDFPQYVRDKANVMAEAETQAAAPSADDKIEAGLQKIRSEVAAAADEGKAVPETEEEVAEATNATD